MKKIFVLGLMLVLCFFLVSSVYASEDVCKNALSRCTADAVVAGGVRGTAGGFGGGGVQQNTSGRSATVSVRSSL